MTAEQPALFDTDSMVKELEADLKAAYQEQIRLNDLVHGYTTDERRRRAEIQATERREAWRTVTHAPRHSILNQAHEPLKALVGAVRNHKCEADTESMRQAAADLDTESRGAVREDQIELGPLGEIRWLRSYIKRAGQRLHEQHGNPNPPKGDRCRCVGCDLIVGTDLDVEIPVGEGALATALQQRLIDAENERDRYQDLLAMQKAMTVRPTDTRTTTQEATDAE